MIASASSTIRRPVAQRGLSVVELLIGIAITAMVALAIGAMLTMVAKASARSRDDQSILMRAHLAQSRLRAYAEPALCVLSVDPAQGVAIWLQDPTPGLTVNLTELRVLWFDSSTQQVYIERVEFPTNWTPLMKQQADVALPKTSDFFATMLAQRAAGMTVTDTLLDTVSTFDLSYTGATAQASDHVRFALTLISDAGDPRLLYVAVGLSNHTEPTS